MIKIESRRLMVNGLGQVSAIRYKARGGAVKTGAWAVVNGAGDGLLEPALALGVYGKPYGIAYAMTALNSTAVYDLSGTVVPVGYTVHLSLVSGDAAVTLQTLTDGEIAAVASNDEGAWSYEGLEGRDGTLYAWILVDNDVLDTLDANVSSNMTVTIQQTAAEDLQYVILAAPTPSSMGEGVTSDGSASCGAHWPTITVTGARAGTAAVYVSKHTPGTALTVSGLTETQVAVEATEEGAELPENYTVTFSGQYVLDADAEAPTHEYVVWANTTETGLTAAMTNVTNNICLSSDTLIAMAGGGTKRLDEIQPGDLLLAGDGTPTRALRTARGCWNTYHTLYTFSDGTVIDEIHDHRFYNVEQGFWQLLRRWNIGEHARRQDGTEVALVSVERVEEPAEMCGLWTESRDYWANGLLSGETAANQTLLADATAEQAAEMAASLDEAALMRLLGMWEESAGHYKP